MDIASAEHAKDPPLLRLTRLQFWGIFATGVLLFLFITGPVWRRPWQFDALNLAILYSYLPLPVLIAGGLFYKKRLGWKAFFLDTLAITLLKYSATFTIALCLWKFAPPAPPEPTSHPANIPLDAPEPPPEPAPLPTPIPEEQTGALSGTVVNSDGAALSGALVFIAKGLEKYVFAAPDTEILLENDGTGVRPRLAAAMLRQPIFARSTDRHLHTLLAVKDGVAVLNVPLLSAGAKAKVRFQEAHGVLELRCRVHEHGEETATLAVFAHPFFTITGPDGRFSWQGVPSGSLVVGGLSRGLGEGEIKVELGARGKAEARIVVLAR